MTFRELLDKYRAGQASEEERALVEAELEKSEAIADYLAEGLEVLEEVCPLSARMSRTYYNACQYPFTFSLKIDLSQEMCYKTCFLSIFCLLS